MPARTPRRSALQALVIGCVLLLAGFTSTEYGAGSPGTAGSNPAVAGDPFAAPRAAAVRAAAIHPASYGARMAGRATSVTGHRLARLGASGVVVSPERVASLTDRTPSGPGDHPAVGPAVSLLSVSPSAGPSHFRWSAAVAVRIPQDTVPARAPPAV